MALFVSRVVNQMGTGYLSLVNGRIVARLRMVFSKKAER